MEFACSSDAGQTALMLMTPAVNAAGVFLLLKGNRMEKLLWLAFAGALGTLSRYALGTVVQQASGGTFPAGTLAVNMVGSLLFGMVWSLAESRLLISGETRIIILTGFMGAFTTFSSVMYETSAFARDAQWAMAGFNLLVQNVSGIMCMIVGLTIGRLAG
jgi:CrcB protein